MISAPANTARRFHHELGLRGLAVATCKDSASHPHHHDRGERLIFRFGDCELDTNSGELRRAGKAVEIQSKPFLVLLYLIRNQGRLVAQNELTRELWPQTAVSASAVRRALSVVRSAIGDDGSTQAMLRTHRGHGYEFIARVTQIGLPGANHPAAHRGVGPSTFTGREDIIASVVEALSLARAEGGQLLLFEGEAGIGKSRMLEECERHAVTADFEVHRGTCLEGEGTPPYLPWRQILRNLVDQRGPEQVQDAAPNATADLLTIEPRLRDIFWSEAPPPTIAGQQAAFRLAESMSLLLTKLAMDRPLFLSIDDLHWADNGSLELMNHIIRDLSDTPLVIAGSYRTFEASREPSRARLLADLSRPRPEFVFELSRLTRSELRDFISARTEIDVHTELLESIEERAGGNPFLTTALLNMLEDRGEQAVLQPTEGQIAPSVIEAVLQPLHHQTPAVHQTLTLAACVGGPFDQAILALAHTGSPEEITRGLEQSLITGLIRKHLKRPDHYYFSHALVAEAIRNSISPGELMATHARLGTALEQLSNPNLAERTGEIAHHFHQAGPEFLKQAATYSRAAGTYAKEHASRTEAAVHLQRAKGALEQLPGNQDALSDVIIELGDTLMGSNEKGRARDIIREALALTRSNGKPALFAQAALIYADEISSGAYRPENNNLLIEALRNVQQAEPDSSMLALQSQLMIRIAYGRTLEIPPEERAARASEAVALARQSCDSRALLLTLKGRHYCLMGPGSQQIRIEVAEEIAATARDTGDRESLGWSAKFQAETALELSAENALARACEKLQDLAEELRHPLFRCYSLHHQAMRALRTGALDEVEAPMTQGLELGLRSGNRVTLLLYGIQLWTLRREQGRLNEIVDQVETLIDQHPDSTGWRAARAYGQIEAGQRGPAEDTLIELIASEMDSIRRGVNWATTPALLSEVCSRVGNESCARILYQELLPSAEQNVTVGLSMADFGPVHRFLGLCAATYDPELARVHFEHAIERADRANLAPASTRAQIDLARLLRRQDRDRSSELAGRAAKRAETIGMPAVLRSAQEVLQS